MNRILPIRRHSPKSITIICSPLRIFYGRHNNILCRRQQHSKSTSSSSSPRNPVSTKTKSSHRQHQRGNNHSDTVLPPYITYGFILPLTGITAASIYAYYSCLDYVPYTNRRRFLATTPQWEAAKGHEQYRALLQQYQGEVLPNNHRASVTVQRVGGRIAAVAKNCSRDWNATTAAKGSNDEYNNIVQSKSISNNNNNIPSSATTTPYTYTVVRSPEANAFVLPGNHVFVLTGLFRYAHNEDELASILGHEMAHNLARHAGERMSESILMGILSRLALVLDPSGLLFSILLPAQTLLVSLPHSREHEVEADRIGIILASEACYDPRAAKRVFSRMKEDVGGGGASEDGRNGSASSSLQPPEFISTHPGYDTRLTLFDMWMPEALERFNKDGGNKCRAIRGEMKRARRLAAEMHDGKEGRRR